MKQSRRPGLGLVRLARPSRRDVTRLSIRLGRRASSVGQRVGTSLNTVLLALIATALLVGILLSVNATHASSETRGLFPLLQDQAVNALSVATLGFVAWLGFRLRFRGSRQRYLQPYRRPPASGNGSAKEAPHTLLQTIVDQLVSARPPRSTLLVSESGGLSPDLEARLQRWIAARGRLPVVIDVAGLDAAMSIPALSRERFVSRLAGSTGDESRAQSLFTREAERGQIIAVVLGLDQIAEAKPRLARRALVDSLLRSCVSERLPFVAPISTELAPHISKVAVVRDDGRYDGVDPSTRLVQLLQERGLPLTNATKEVLRAGMDVTEGIGDPWYLDVVAEVIVARLRRGQEPDQAVREVFALPRAFHRQLSWLCERSLGYGLDEARGRSSSEAWALALIGRQAHYREEVATRWSDVTRDLDGDEELRFAAAVSILTRRDVITVVDDDGDRRLRFEHPDWLVFAGALGLGLDGDRWSELLTPGVPQATIRSLTTALVFQERGGNSNRSFLRVLRELKRGDLRDLSLDMITGVVRALQLDRQVLEIGDAEFDALHRAWRTSIDQARFTFVATVEPHAALARFLWDQVVPPQFEANSYGLRRAICARLAGMGGVAWHQLSGTWHDLVAAGATADLTAEAQLNKPDWELFGWPIASAAWVLPSLTELLVGADQQAAMGLLRDLRKLLTGTTTPDRRPGVGLEISLAEGFKLASIAGGTREEQRGRPWGDEADRLLEDARSWTSRLVLHQALAIATPSGTLPARTRAGSDDDEDPHPFVREAVALALRALDRTAAGTSRQQPTGIRDRRRPGDIWFDDVRALEDGGFELSAEAHRLLALSTLLINLAEGASERARRLYLSQRQAEPSPEALRGVRFREQALTDDALPRCFVAAGHATTMFDVACDCQFKLCGPDVRGGFGHRQISQAFAERAAITSGARVASATTVFVRRPFGQVWQRPEIVREGLTP